MEKRLKWILNITLIVVMIIIGGYFVKDNILAINDSKIDKILQTKEYSYLPKEALSYIKEVYEQTGEIILTEKNKEENKLYLNPQYVEYLTYSDEEKDETGNIPVSMVIDYSSRDISESINVPSSYDLRNDNGRNYITPIRDQGNLGLCWAFATAGVAESYLLKTSNTSYNASSKLISERQIDYATSRNGIKDYKNEYVSFINRSLGDGGNFYISTIALANGISFVDYNSFKEYNDRDMQKMELQDVLNYNKSLYEVNSTTNFPRLNIRESTKVLTEEEKETRNSYLNEVKHKIMEKGAAYVNTYMHSSCQYEDTNLNNTVIDVYNCSAASGHAMEIIGWDDNLEYSYCAETKVHTSDTSNCKRVISGKGVWILKNSWGEDIPYPYLTYDSQYTGISFIDEIQNSKDKDWDNNYILGTGSEPNKSKIYNLSNTKIENDEKIEKIKFIAETPKTQYNVKIKKKDGTYETFSKTSDLPGLITIDIKNDIIVNKNTEITVYSDNEFIDRISIFTSNINSTPAIDLTKYNNKTIAEKNIRLYSETKNIPSNSMITYKIYNENEQDISNRFIFENNTIAENNINTLAIFPNDLDNGIYRIDTLYNSNVIGNMNIHIVNIEGEGTKDNPYIITNSTQLYQMRNDLDAYYELGNDIDLTEDTHEGGKYSFASEVCPQGFGWESINGFSGSLDGKGHTIKGLYQNNYITCNEEKKIWHEWNNTGNGLFGTMKGSAIVKNLVLEDFDITCQGGYCGALVSKYIANMNELGNPNWDDKTEYTATFESIAIKNSKMKGEYEISSGGGLFGSLDSSFGNINISNIYLDIDMNTKNLKQNAYLLSIGTAKNMNIQNIRILGNLQGKHDDGSGDYIMAYQLSAKNIKNIISTVTATNVASSLFGTSTSDTLQGINILNIDDKPLCSSSNCQNATNVNTYDKNTQLVELTKQENYNSWDSFNSNWVIKTIDGIPRIPVLKFMNFDYTSISDITLNQILNKKVSIYDYVTPKIDAAKRLIYRSNNEEIVKVDDEGNIIPQSEGNTTIHVESLYDGYIKDVPISVNYIPHYTINFDANEGTGTMQSIEVETGKNFKLPENEFVKEYYEFKEWNTKADGTGTSYKNLAEISAMNDKESITLYAIWWGEERIVTFDANGGTVNPDRKTVRIRQKYGELPVPIRDGYGFDGWADLKGSLYVDAFAQLSGLELTARWITDAYTITYDANGGTIEEDYKNKHAIYLHSETIATDYGKNGQDKDVYDYLYEREGCTFKEWNTKADGTGTSYTDEQTINRSSNITLYAIWEPDENSYDISLNSNNIVSDTFNINLNINPLSNNPNNINTIIGNIIYDHSKLELTSYTTINNFNVSLNNNKFNIISNTGINTNNDVLTLTFKNIGLSELDKTTITINELIANNGEITLTKNSVSKEVIYSKNGFLKGDMNINGKIDLKDIIILIKKYLGVEDANNEDVVVGDMNNNGKIDLKDIILLIKVYLNIA